MDFSGSRTETNLRSAISGEAQAALLYEFYAARAKKDGFEGIAEVFRETSQNEKAHAEIYWKLLDYFQTTDKNLSTAASAENYENSQMYPEFARVAREEGFEEIAATFEMVGKIEKSHQTRYELLKSRVENGTVFERAMETEWICNNCGHRHKGNSAPKLCPVCSHPRSFFQVLCECL